MLNHHLFRYITKSFNTKSKVDACTIRHSYMTAMLQNLSNRENISKGMVSRMDRLATYVDLPFPCPNLIGAPVVHVLPLQRRYERSHLVPFSRGCSTPMTTHN